MGLKYGALFAQKCGAQCLNNVGSKMGLDLLEKCGAQCVNNMGSKNRAQKRWDLENTVCGTPSGQNNLARSSYIAVIVQIDW